MNRYGLLAQEHWRRHAPGRYETLENPEAFFQDLGESVLAQVDQTASSLERQLPADLPYLERVAALRAIQNQAEESALADLVFSVEPEPTDLAQELEDALALLPDPVMIQDSLARIELEALEEAEREGRPSPVLTAEQEQRRHRLMALQPLVSGPDPEEMDEASLRDRLLALAPYLPTQETGR